MQTSGRRPLLWWWAALLVVTAAACGSTVSSRPGAFVADPPSTRRATTTATTAAAAAVDDVASAQGALGDGTSMVADATDVGRRGPSSTPIGGCDLALVAALAARHPEAGQWIVTRTPSWAATSGTLQVAVRTSSGSWACQRGERPAMVGLAGTRPLADRRSGDGTAPAGVFPLGTTTAWDGQRFQFFGNGPDPGVRGTYRSVRAGDCWGANPGAASYNHLVLRSASSCAGADEYLAAIAGPYVNAAVIGANGEPDVSGDAPGETPFAAAIFLHRHAYAGTTPKPTHGCVSLAIEDLVPVLDLIDPASNPRFAIGPGDWLLTDA